MTHVPVLLQEVIELMDIRPDGTYVDATLGRGGHTTEILKRLAHGRLIAFDQDEAAILAGQSLQSTYEQLTLVHANFRLMRQELERLKIQGVDGILFDLGVSSPQFDDPMRGFSYRADAPLDMRMDQRQSLDAAVVVNTYSQQALSEILRRYGEEPFARAIAASIIRHRPLMTTGALVEAIRDALPARILSRSGHPARRSFQAIRIEVNGELSILEQALRDAAELLNPGGRLAVISFHSLEDRIVKQVFRQLSRPPATDRRLPQTEVVMHYREITKHPVVASDGEQQENHRARSAKLRVLERN